MSLGVNNILTVDAAVIHKVDTANPQHLYRMWFVFSRCSTSVEQGRRLENLAWRQWTSTTLLPDAKVSPLAETLPQPIPAPEPRIPDVPGLSGSVDSISSADSEAIDLTTDAAPLDIIRPRILRQDSGASTRSRSRIVSSEDFGKMMVGIVTDSKPLNDPLPEFALPCILPAKKEAPITVPLLERSGSTTTESLSKSSDEPSEASQQPSSPEMSRTEVVHGFSPSKAVPSTLLRLPQATHAIPEPKSTPAHHPIQPKKTQATFALGGSYSSSEADHSVEDKRPVLAVPLAKKKMFVVGGSSEEESSLKSALHSSTSSRGLNAPKKQASFLDQPVTRTIPTTSAVADDTDTEADYVDESAIDDDDDSSDWEDSVEDSGKSSIDEKTFFQRVDSSANLTTRRSLITLMLEDQGEHAKKLGNVASQSTSALPRSRTMPTVTRPTNEPESSPSDSDDQHLMMKRGVRPTALKPINEVPRSAAQPILTTAGHGQAQAALSPRTTRRNMLATELTESLRRHLLWERQQKSSTANAVLKRRHTSHDVANLKQYPEKPYMTKNEDVNASSWNNYFSKDLNGYHSKGW